MAKTKTQNKKIAESLNLVRFTIALPPEVHELLKVEAETDCRTLVGQVAWILKTHFETVGKK